MTNKTMLGSYPFTPADGVGGTLDLSSISGFNFAQLNYVRNITRNTDLYILGDDVLTATCNSSGVVTFAASTAGMADADIIDVRYDDQSPQPVADSALLGAINTGLAQLHADLVSENSTLSLLATAVGNVLAAVGAVSSAVNATTTAISSGNASAASIASNTASLASALGSIESLIAAGNTALGVLHSDGLDLQGLMTAGNTALAAIEVSSAAGATAAGQASALSELNALATQLGLANTTLTTIASNVNALGTTLGGGATLHQIVTALGTPAQTGDINALGTLLSGIENSQLTELEALATAVGNPSDAQASSDTGTFSFMGLFKRLLAKLQGWVGTAGSPSANVLSVQGAGTTATPVVVQQGAGVYASGNITSATSTVTLAVPQGMTQVAIRFTGTWSANLTWSLTTLDGGNPGLQLYRFDSGQIIEGGVSSNGNYGANLPPNVTAVTVSAAAYTSGTASIVISAGPGASPYPGNQNVSVTSATGGILGLTGTSADATGIGTSALNISQTMLFNSTNWDRERNNYGATVLSSTTITSASSNTSSQTNYNGSGIALFFDVTAISGSNTMTATLQATDPTSGLNFAMPAGSIAINATGKWMLVIYPGVNPVSSGNSQAQSGVVPRVWLLNLVQSGGSPSITMSIGVEFMN